jgi:hypothetical protein
LIIARLLITAAISERRADAHADNRTYITQYDRANRRVLDQLAALTPADLAARLHTIAGTATSPAGDLGGRRAAAEMARRVGAMDRAHCAVSAGMHCRRNRPTCADPRGFFPRAGAVGCPSLW